MAEHVIDIIENDWNRGEDQNDPGNRKHPDRGLEDHDQACVLRDLRDRSQEGDREGVLQMLFIDDNRIHEFSDDRD